MILVEFSGSFAQCLLSAISGLHDGDLICLTRREVNKLRDGVCKVLCLHHYSIHTERSYGDWIVRFVRFHGMRSREDLSPAEPKIEAFLTDRAVNGNVAPATQNQAMNALVFLYKVRPQPCSAGQYQCRSCRQEDQRPRCHDTRRSRRRYFAHGRNRPRKENRGQTEISNSIAADAKQFAHAVRGHWSVENRLHWRLDVVFREDESRLRKGNAPPIMTAIRHLCVNLFQKEPSNLSLKKKRLKAAWNDDFRGKVLFA
jgi:predicted transposase YbfD/YdcC